VTDIEGRLRGASDSLLEGLDRLTKLEEQKRSLTPGTPAFAKAAADITQLAQELLQASAMQERLAAHTVELRAAGSDAAPDQPIKDMSPRDLAEILREWRAAERQLAEAAPGSAEAVGLAATASRLRDEYQRAHDVEAGKDR
jgi:uncharacterized protein YdeI (YjbR/CyaY-like superfamily)